MRALLFHCRNYAVKLERLANRPHNIEPEKIEQKEQKCNDCVVALITVEDGDDAEKCSSELTSEIRKMALELNQHNVVLLPFAHLSNKLANFQLALVTLDLTGKKLNGGFKITRAHFGSHKELLLDIYGHPGNARYREF